MPRPRVIAHNVASLDGRITVAPNTLLVAGEPRWSAIAGSAGGYGRIMQRYRPEVILEGSGSLVSDLDQPTPLPGVDDEAHERLRADFLPAEVVGVPGRRWFTVVDSRGRVRWQFKQFPDPDWAAWHLLVLVSRQTPPEYLAYLRRETIPYLVIGQSRVDLAAAIRVLGERFAAATVVSTGGGRLNGALLRAGLVDSIDIEFLPAIIGGAATPALFDAAPLGPDEWPTPLALASVEVHADGSITALYETGDAQGRAEGRQGK
jgi:riboflavin biosynthesis pyrimidine reductase